jgi:alkylated DNA nucleotide flippase Atl1
LHIVAGASEEQLAARKRPAGPYWRVVDRNGSLNPKWPPGPERQAIHLRREGHRVRHVRGSGRWQVVGFER